jgi:hypothetical protein
MQRARTFLLLGCLALLASPLAAYTVILKDGSTLVAREKYRVQGNQAIILLPSGTRTSIALAEIDVERTREANTVDYGDALVVGDDGEVTQVVPDDKDKGPSLIDVARRNRAQRATGQDDEEDPAQDPASQRMPLTPAGNVDLLRANRIAFSSVEIGTLISQVLRNQGVEGASIYQGTRPGRVFLEFTTNSEASVFRAIEASARALVELEQQRPGAIQAFELFMATDDRVRAGQFLVTPDRAQELLTRRIDLPGFFLKYVQF